MFRCLEPLKILTSTLWHLLFPLILFGNQLGCCFDVLCIKSKFNGRCLALGLLQDSLLLLSECFAKKSGHSAPFGLAGCCVMRGFPFWTILSSDAHQKLPRKLIPGLQSRDFAFHAKNCWWRQHVGPCMDDDVGRWHQQGDVIMYGDDVAVRQIWWCGRTWQWRGRVTGQYGGRRPRRQDDVANDSADDVTRRKVVNGFMAHRFWTQAVSQEGAPPRPGRWRMAGVRRQYRPSPGR